MIARLEFFIAIATLATLCSSEHVPADALLQKSVVQVSKGVEFVGEQYAHDPDRTAKNTATGQWEWSSSTGWTSGFWPGTLWQLANYTDSKALFDKAHSFTLERASEANNTGTHDVGFMVFYSFGKGLELARGFLDASQQSYYQSTIVQAAHSLSTRWSPIVRMLRSWGSVTDTQKFEVIIDNLMNLELLFWAAKTSGNQTFHSIAHEHALRTGQYWIRPDGSTYHEVIFNPETAAVLSRTGTPQGYAANSTWARGQAWGIYGFTMAYRYTRDPQLLAYAETVAAYYIANVPSDLVPKWDFDVPPPGDYRDTSAASITAAGLYELAHFTGNSTYRTIADSTLVNLSSAKYTSAPSASMAILKENAHDCQDPLCTIIESDYYYVEALQRVRRLQQ